MNGVGIGLHLADNVDMTLNFSGTESAESLQKSTSSERGKYNFRCYL